MPNKREYDSQRNQANEEVFISKKNFHETSMSYFTSLNMMQLKRESIIVEPMISLMQSLKLFFKMGDDMCGGNGSKLEG